MKDGNAYNIALASYYCGCYFKEFGRLKEAMENYQLALKFAEKIDDLNLKSLINNAIGFVFTGSVRSGELRCVTSMNRQLLIYRQEM